MKQNILIITAIIGVLGLYIFIQTQKHTTFGEKVQDQLDGGEVLGIIVTKFEEDEPEYPRYPDRVAETTLKKEGAQTFLEGLESIRLKEVDNLLDHPKYRITISYEVEVQERHTQHKTMSFSLNEDLVQHDGTYESKEDINPVQLVEELLEEQDVEWENLRN
ncbi:hypothetical protein ACTWQB_00590 [Piscibacillus sp. B03]|uniref:hypothetical protein n=1 Tax=Piscibacillus sp. B03 TaxID=3457430 RepID=UPI003FCD1E85